MSSDIFMKEFVTKLRSHFDDHQDIFSSFVNHGVQVEGWVKGELLYFLDSESFNGKLIKFDREVRTGNGRRKVDFRLTIRTEEEETIRLWIELKHWLVGYQKGTRWKANSYFKDSSSVGIKPDVEKLEKIENGEKYLIVLATTNPGKEDWNSGIQNFNSKYHPLALKSLTFPRDFPNSYFLGLLKLI